VTPRYGSGCISGIPAAVANLLGLRLPGSSPAGDLLGGVDLSGIDNIVLVVCDGFGMHEWKRQEEGGVVKDLTLRGRVRPITTVFPSTTAAALTTLATGLTPQEHALPEWFVYMKEVNSVILTLPFSFMGDRGRETLKGHMKPSALFRGTPVFKKLRASGVETYSFTSRGLVGTTYTRLVHGASNMVPYFSSSDMVPSLRRTVESASGPSFSYVYWSHVDAVEHEFGPGTDESGLEASSISFLLHAGFVSKLERNVARRTLLILTADHGQVATRVDDTLYLNRFRSLTKNFRKVGGKRVTPAGSPRDVFLYLDEDSVDEAFDYLRGKLAGRATVLKTEDAIRAGLFGLNAPSRKFEERIGDLLVLPHGNGTVWYRGEPGYELELRGLHGGLSADEMLVPLALGRVSDLQDRAG
jgi:predicted AlkP superfamily pyrophosphatase or phosphodiesterase